jgi:rhamnosyltransferase
MNFMETPSSNPLNPTGAMPLRRKVLVLLAAYNGAAWIGEQVESILQQERVDLRLVVRDDESSDSTVEAVNQLVATDTRIELLRAGKSSGSASQNFFALIRHCDAKGFDFVAFSDQDDIWHRDKLYQAVESLTASRSAGYSSAVTASWPDGKARLLRQSDSVTDSDYLFEGAGQGCTFVLTESFYAILRAFVITHEGLTCGAHFHDWTIYALARTWAFKWTFNPHSTMSYRQHAQNDTGARTGFHGIVVRLSRIRQGWYREQLVRIAALCKAASADTAMISRWYQVLHLKKSWNRRARIARFCMRGGRRRVSDNIVLIFSSLMGWL